MLVWPPGLVGGHASKTSNLSYLAKQPSGMVQSMQVQRISEQLRQAERMGCEFGARGIGKQISCDHMFLFFLCRHYYFLLFIVAGQKEKSRRELSRRGCRARVVFCSELDLETAISYLSGISLEKIYDTVRSFDLEQPNCVRRASKNK